jgi:hypothetical protein
VTSFANDWVIKTGIPPPKVITKTPTGVNNAQSDTNELFTSMEQDIKRIILGCWDGAKLRDEEKRLFRKHMEMTKGQWIFITQLN